MDHSLGQEEGEIEKESEKRKKRVFMIYYVYGVVVVGMTPNELYHCPLNGRNDEVQCSQGYGQWLGERICSRSSLVTVHCMV